MKKNRTVLISREVNTFSGPTGFRLYDCGELYYYNLTNNDTFSSRENFFANVFPQKDLTRAIYAQRKNPGWFSMYRIKTEYSRNSKALRNIFSENIELSDGELIYLNLALRRKSILVVYERSTKTILFLDLLLVRDWRLQSAFSLNNPISFKKGGEILKNLKENDPLIVTKNKNGYCFEPIDKISSRIKKNKGEIVFLGKFIDGT